MVEIVGYRVCAGPNEDSAKLNPFKDAESCLNAARSAKFPGVVLMAPVTEHGTGRWLLVAKYDGGGVVVSHPDGIEVGPEELVESLRVRLMFCF